MVDGAIDYATHMRAMADYLYDGDQRTFEILLFIKSNFRQWYVMTEWLYKNRIRGAKLVEFFQDASPDGGGYLNGCAKILRALRLSTKVDALR